MSASALRPNWQAGRNSFVKYVGVAKTQDGILRPKLFLLGPEVEAATIRLAIIRRAWKQLEATGLTTWDSATLESLADATAFTSIPAVSIPASTTAIPRTRQVIEATPTPKKATVAEAVTAYVAGIEKQFTAGQVSKAHYDSQRYRLAAAVGMIVEGKPLSAFPLSHVSEAEIEAVVLALCSRPEFNTKRGKRRISVVYAKAACKTLKWFLEWCEESPLYLWQRPIRFARIFKKARPVVLPAEIQMQAASVSGEPDHATLSEMKAIYSAATDWQRLILLLGWNCGFCTGEIATLTRGEVKGLDGRSPFIERLRRKTMRFGPAASYGKWNLWPETAALLRKFMAEENADDLAILNLHGNSLTRSNSFGQSWEFLLKDANVRHVEWKVVGRKTAAFLLRVTLGYGREIADQFLAHADHGMIKHYSGRNWSKLASATSALRRYLRPVLSAAPKSASKTLTAKSAPQVARKQLRAAAA